MWCHNKQNKSLNVFSPFFPSGEEGRESKGEFSTVATCLQKVKVWKCNTDQNKYLNWIVLIGIILLPVVV